MEPAFIQCHQESYGVWKSFDQISKALKIKYGFSLLKRSTKTNEIELLAKKIFSLPRGCYFMIIPVEKACAHAVSFIREKNDRFFIDANHGAIRVSNKENLELLISEYMTEKNRANNPKQSFHVYKATRAR